MEKIIDYKVLMTGTQVRPEDFLENGKDIAEMRESLRKQVIKYINEGYQPFGGISITSKAPDCMLYLAQAVVKYE